MKIVIFKSYLNLPEGIPRGNGMNMAVPMQFDSFDVGSVWPDTAR